MTMFITGFLALLTFLPMVTKRWVSSVLTFFRLQYAVIALIFALYLLFTGAYLLGGINIVLMIVNLVKIRKFLKLSRSKIKKTTKRQFMSINCYKENSNAHRIVELILEAMPEVLLLMEVSKENKAELKDIMEIYPHQMSVSVRDGFEIHLLSKHELLNQKVLTFGEAGTPMLSADIYFNDEPLNIYGVHPRPSLSNDWHKARLSYFEDVKSELEKRKHENIIMMGDFNSVIWEDHFEKFLKDTRLKSTIDQELYCITWPTFFPIMGIPMDHILVSEKLYFNSIYIGPFIGSDHYPISMNLTLEE